MAQYRLYRRAPHGRTLIAPVIIEAERDTEAMRLAREAKVTPCEVWQEARLVAIIGAQ